MEQLRGLECQWAQGRAAKGPLSHPRANTEGNPGSRVGWGGCRTLSEHMWALSATSAPRWLPSRSPRAAPPGGPDITSRLARPRQREMGPADSCTRVSGNLSQRPLGVPPHLSWAKDGSLRRLETTQLGSDARVLPWGSEGRDIGAPGLPKEGQRQCPSPSPEAPASLTLVHTGCLTPDTGRVWAPRPLPPSPALRSIPS